VLDRPASACAIRAAATKTLLDAADDKGISARLAVVGASVAIELRQLTDETFVIRMADGAVAVRDGDDPHADIRLSMDAVDLHELFAGGLHLPMKIADGQVTFTGQVRRFLRICAILVQMKPAYLARLVEARASDEAGR
jgi:hypothetical protein